MSSAPRFLKILSHSDADNTSDPKRKFRITSFLISAYRNHKSVRKEERIFQKYRLAIRPQKYFKDLDMMNERMNQSLRLDWSERNRKNFSVILLSSPLDSLPVNQFQDHHQLVLRRFVVHASALRAVPSALHDVCADPLCDEWGANFSVRYDLDVNSM